MREETRIIYSKYLYCDESINYLSLYDFLHYVIDDDNTIRKFVNEKYDFFLLIGQYHNDMRIMWRNYNITLMRYKKIFKKELYRIILNKTFCNDISLNIISFIK